jgi:hypothetical protein
MGQSIYFLGKFSGNILLNDEILDIQANGLRLSKWVGPLSMPPKR